MKDNNPNNMTYTLYGEYHGDVVINVNSNRPQDVFDVEVAAMKQFCLSGNVKEDQGITDDQWIFMKQGKIDIGFTYMMVVLTKGEPNEISTSKTQNGAMDILWYYWGHVVLMNDHVTEIDT